jgi:hypothetical protein
MSEYDYLERDGLETLRWAEVEGPPLWTTPPQTHLARMRHGATLLGIPLQVYLEHCEQGEHWCSYHRAWEPAERFSPRTGRVAGALATKCREGAAAAQRERQRRRRAARGPGGLA